MSAPSCFLPSALRRYDLMMRWMMREHLLGRVWQTPRKEKAVMGILVFEAASLMSKLVGLWQSLEDDCVQRLRREVLNSEGVRQLVSHDDDYLLGLALTEMFDTLGFVARAAVRLGKHCSNPAMESLEALLDDLVKRDADPHRLEYNWIKMGKKVKKMERFVAASRTLYEKMEALEELEQRLKKMQLSNGDMEQNLKNRVVQQRQLVKDMRENSLWSRNYDYTVRLLVRSLCTIFRRMMLVFGISHPTVDSTADSRVLSYVHLPPSQSISPDLLRSSVHPPENSLARLASSPFESPTGAVSCTLYSYRSNRLLTRSRSFRGCVTGCSGNKSLMFQNFDSMWNGSDLASTPKEFSHVESFIESNSSFFTSKSGLMLSPPPSTLGAAALELRYANVIVAIEKFMTCPSWILPEEREILYRMLPGSIRAVLRMELKSCPKNLKLTASDAGVADKYTNAMEQVLKWLAPLAHNTIRWQSQQTLELKRHLVLKKNILLVQTLYFANQAKTEAAITELLVGLNYICRFEGEEVILEGKGCIRFGDYLNGKG